MAGDLDRVFPGVGIRAVSHPSVVLALLNRADFLQHGSPIHALS
jgi:hypothetical protein